MKVSNGKAMEKDIKRFDYWFSHNYQELRNKLYGAFLMKIYFMIHTCILEVLSRQIMFH
ncbi:hypothetical protein HMPREF9011_02522 [Bacteroides sp. 3_1_40A]|nr:hypothetical protein HMPREF9011_02522 [Bacteroides sp. 3_1_40A]